MSVRVEFKKGDRVKLIRNALKGNRGRVLYIGKVGRHKETFLGIELDDPLGVHNGTVNGRRYYKCKPKYGYMAPQKCFKKLKSRNIERLKYISISYVQGFNKK